MRVRRGDVHRGDTCVCRGGGERAFGEGRAHVRGCTRVCAQGIFAHTCARTPGSPGVRPGGRQGPAPPQGQVFGDPLCHLPWPLPHARDPLRVQGAAAAGECVCEGTRVSAQACAHACVNAAGRSTSGAGAGGPAPGRWGRGMDGGFGSSRVRKIGGNSSIPPSHPSLSLSIPPSLPLSIPSLPPSVPPVLSSWSLRSRSPRCGWKGEAREGAGASL